MTLEHEPGAALVVDLPVLGQQLHSIILKVSSNLNDSMILSTEQNVPSALYGILPCLLHLT